MSRSSNSKKKLPNPLYFSKLAELEITHLEEMMSSIDSYLEGVQDDIKDRAEKASPEKYAFEHEYHSYVDLLNDELVQIKEVEDISKKLSIVGLYMIVESFTKKIMKWLYQDLDEETKEKKLRILHKRKVLKEELNDLCALDLSEVSEYSVVDELRCLNNVIKHSGYVDNKLSSFSNWQNDFKKEVATEKIDFNKFCESIPKYIHGLVTKIKEYIA